MRQGVSFFNRVKNLYDLWAQEPGICDFSTRNHPDGWSQTLYSEEDPHHIISGAAQDRRRDYPGSILHRLGFSTFIDPGRGLFI